MQSDELEEDDFSNLRYIGANPNNYVRFNDELWRIIGVMKDIENADGTKEDKVKLIRSESIGSYAWDNNNINDWNTSALQKVLNEGAYWNRTSGTCPNGIDGATTTCDFSPTGLTNESKEKISEVVWNLGGISTYKDVIAKTYYEKERGTDVYKGRPTKWTGKVGLMYPSDYGYATAGGATTDRATCLNTSLGYGGWNGSEVSDCKNNDWLLSEWTITPLSSYSNSGLIVSSAGVVTGNSMYGMHAIRPSIYLDSGVGIESGGTGSSASPLVLK